MPVTSGRDTRTHPRISRVELPSSTVAHEVLGRTLDELPPQTPRLLTLLRDWVAAECVAAEWRDSGILAKTRWPLCCTIQTSIGNRARDDIRPVRLARSCSRLNKADFLLH
ncbi:hypothetical protein LMG26411_07452 [Cupriavidus numazuensis]|uniref:Transposase n=1 Tax=Cupriavidus numazuensis TaxID=221992 RepID=A0ABN7QAA2_9BURK|nr:hypothetical protein LMG26411_07452 [Cupriavidus numazuensis]